MRPHVWNLLRCLHLRFCRSRLSETKEENLERKKNEREEDNTNAGNKYKDAKKMTREGNDK